MHDWFNLKKQTTESYSTGILATFKSKCRVISEEEFKVPLPGITEIFGDEDTFDFEIKNVKEFLFFFKEKSSLLQLFFA